MKRNRFTTAAMLFASILAATPQPSQARIINNRTGGTDSDFKRMHVMPSPIYFPRYHPILTWNQQRQKAKKRRK